MKNQRLTAGNYQAEFAGLTDSYSVTIKRLTGGS